MKGRTAPHPPAIRHDAPLLREQDVHLFNEGTHHRLYRVLGAHPLRLEDGTTGTAFAVWAPNAEEVSLAAGVNGWHPGSHPLAPLGGSGIWQGFVPGVGVGEAYRYHVVGRGGSSRVDKADPFAFMAETPPRTASVVWDLDYAWGDGEWLVRRAEANALDAPISIYELHVGSWRRAEGNRPLTYRELAPRLVEYVAAMGYTHVELLPVMEHPFYGSWGYQTTGYFAPTSRYGTPQDFMALVDALHQAGIGVILDWVPSHFPNDEHGLGLFDGTHLYEHADPRLGFHPDWKSYVFDFGRNEVRSFLLSSALHWLDTYHADGLRVDAVASMLYLDYSRGEGEWIPNQYGGRENLAAIGFLRQLNEAVYGEHPHVQTVAEESTAWPMVSRPVHVGGLGFGMKWDMGWMHDTLRYLSREPIHRRFQHNDLTFRLLYAFGENYVLPLSHDEVVHGKGSLIGKMPGDEWQRFANLRLLFGAMWSQPGKKLLFQGGDIGQWREWDHDDSTDWNLLRSPLHAGLQRWVADLNRLYRQEPALHRREVDPRTFEWVDPNDSEASAITFLRLGGDDVLLVACNFTPVVRENYLVGVPRGGFWREVLNSDADVYGGSGRGNFGGVEAVPVSVHGRPKAVRLTLPPLGCLFLKSQAS